MNKTWNSTEHSNQPDPTRRALLQALIAIPVVGLGGCSSENALAALSPTSPTATTATETVPA